MFAEPFEKVRIGFKVIIRIAFMA